MNCKLCQWRKRVYKRDVFSSEMHYRTNYTTKIITVSEQLRVIANNWTLLKNFFSFTGAIISQRKNYGMDNSQYYFSNEALGLLSSKNLGQVLAAWCGATKKSSKEHSSFSTPLSSSNFDTRVSMLAAGRRGKITLLIHIWQHLGCAY